MFAGENAYGRGFTALGAEAGRNATGTYATYLGFQAGSGNTATDVIALGYGTGISNTYSNVVLVGNSIGAEKNNQVVLGNASTVEVSTSGIVTSRGVKVTDYFAESCDASHLGALKYTSGAFYLCQNASNGWEPLATSGATANTDRIISGTTGIYTYSDTSASIATAGVERLVVGTNGNIGIGQQPIANIALSTSGTSYFSGNVGIGTSTPASALHISGTAIPLRLSGSGDSNLDSYTNYIAAYDGDGLTVWRLGDDFPSQRRVVISARGPSAAYYPLDLETALVTRMRILSTGEVGIGTVNPSTTLHVSGTARANTLQLPDQAAIGTCDSTSHNTMKFVNGRPYYCRP